MSRSDNGVVLPVSYRHEWQDGLGARGWKLDSSIGDPAVIAATAESGERIPTSVFVHDVFDHALCGLTMSGHRNEAIALIQLALRTGVSPRPDFAQMVDEDLMHGEVNGESLRSFLGDEWQERWPKGVTDGGEAVTKMVEVMGREALREAFIGRFFELGFAGAGMAINYYSGQGLDYSRRATAALTLQTLLKQLDQRALNERWEAAGGEVQVNNDTCVMRLFTPDDITVSAPITGH